ncbi:uncharacterized protein FTOL_13949 [Fusarium torulosum]|nr:uncharacterized protein FTOL_13949 [Fusarium torulosum]
MPAGLYY